MSVSPGIRYDPYDVEINLDPHPSFRRLREEAPVYYDESHDFWALSRYEDVEKALRDWQTFSSARGDILEVVQSGLKMPSGILLAEDPPVHTVHRKLMARVFTPRRMNALEERARRFCAECLEPLVGESRFDLVACLGAIMPMRIIGMLLGIPESDQTQIRDTVDEILRTEPGRPMAMDRREAVTGEMYAEYIEWRSKHPSDDLMTLLLESEFEDERGERRRLTRREVLTYTQLLSGAGNETTGRLIGWLGKVLADHPDQRRLLVEDRSLIPNAIEEVLRFEPTGPHIARWVTRDVESHGRTIPAQSAILLLVGAANRDPGRFPDPDRFDIHRRDVAHLTFGFGPHFCLGAALARMEARVALDELLDRFPEWELAHHAMRLAPTSTVRGWETLPILVG